MNRTSLSVALSSFVVVGCGCSGHTSPDARIELFDSSAPITPPDTSPGGEGLNLDADPDAPPPVGGGCSADLQNIIDDKGKVVTVCPSDQGCSKGACVPACQAAADSKGNIGCDFVVPTPSFYVGILPPCFAIFLANSWGLNVHITVSRAGKMYSVSKFGKIPTTTSVDASSWPSIGAAGVPPGKVGVLFMSSDPLSVNGTPLKCPITPAIDDGTPAVIGSGKGAAWHIKTDVPVSAYDIMPYGGAKSYLPSAELILPTSAWGTNYVAVVPSKESPFSSFGGPQWGQVVAMQDGTTVKIVPTTSLPSAGSASAISAGKVGSFTLKAGEFVQWQPSDNMSGSIISANNPIAYTGGTGYLCLKSATSTGGGCDSGHQQVFPVATLGFEYVAAPYATRRQDNNPESVPYRIVGAVKGTKLTYNPSISGAPKTLTLGQFVDFESDKAFVISSQDKDHPFIVTQMMSGCSVTGGSKTTSCLGDEEHVNVLPPAQFLSRYVFFTDPTYPTTNLVLTRVKAADGSFKDVKIDCMGVVGGWKNVGGGGKYQVTDVDLIRGGAGTKKCTNGPQLASSEGAFGLTVWGLDSFSSYAYPAGGNLATINSVVIPPTPQ